MSLRSRPGRATSCCLVPSSPSPEPAAGLRAQGWTVRLVPVYRTVVAPQPPDVVADWSGFDAFVVTAGSVARAAVEAGGLPGPKVVAIGEAAAAAARDVGLDVIAVADRPDAGGITEALLAAPGRTTPDEPSAAAQSIGTRSATESSTMLGR